MNENKKATEFTPEEIQTDVELTDEELGEVAGGAEFNDCPICGCPLPREGAKCISPRCPSNQ